MHKHSCTMVFLILSLPPVLDLGFTDADRNSVPVPSFWSEESHSRFLNALAGNISPTSLHDSTATVPNNTEATDSLAALMASFDHKPSFAPLQGPRNGKAPASLRMQPRLPKLIPLTLLVSVWCVFAYFVLWRERAIFEEKSVLFVEQPSWSRWSDLSWRSPMNEGVAWGVQVVVSCSADLLTHVLCLSQPFFWAFVTLQLIPFSLRIFPASVRLLFFLKSWDRLIHYDKDAVEPGALLSTVLPLLPPPFHSLIVNGLGCLQMFNLFLDDL